MVTAQSTTEFLTTYGWAIIILAIVLATLFELGVFNAGVSASTCIPAPGFICKDPIYASNQIGFTFGQSNGRYFYGNWVFVASQSEALNQQGIPVNYSVGNAVSIGLPESGGNVITSGQTFYVDFSDFAAGDIPSGAISGTNFAGYVWLGYCLVEPCTAPTAYEKVATMTLVSIGGAAQLQPGSGPSGGAGGTGGGGQPGSASNPYDYAGGWQGTGYYDNVLGYINGALIPISSQSQYYGYATSTTTSATSSSTTTILSEMNMYGGYSGSGDVLFTVPGTLGGNIVTTGNIVIEQGVTVTSDGYSFIAGGTFTNYGTIDTGSAGNGGAGGTHCCSNPAAGGSYSSSYGGSGGGGGSGYAANGGDGGDTLVYGGFGGVSIPLRCGNSVQDGIAGSTPSNPASSLTNNQIQSFYGNGMVNYLSGAGGGGGGQDAGRCDGNGGNGGAGAYGLYIQATAISSGIVNSSGRDGANGYILGCGNGGAGGGGGGGSIMLAYETSVSLGTIADAGGMGGHPSYDNGCALAGYGGGGGNGDIIEYRWGSPPVAT